MNQQVLSNDEWRVVLSYLSRWHGVALRSVSKEWKAVLRTVDFVRLGVVATIQNKICFFSRKGGLRALVEALPWEPSTRVDPTSDEAEAVQQMLPLFREESAACVCCLPRRMFVSQYGMEGLLVYAVDDGGMLYYEKAISHVSLAYPEGIVQYKHYILVATSVGNIVVLDGDVVKHVVRFPNFVFWNMTIHENMLLVAAHLFTGRDDPFGAMLESPQVDGGYILHFAISDDGNVTPEFNLASGPRALPAGTLASHLSKPSAVVIYGEDFLVASYINTTDETEGKMRTVYMIDRQGNVSTPFPDFVNDFEPWGLAVHGDDVYICGFNTTFACYNLREQKLVSTSTYYNKTHRGRNRITMGDNMVMTVSPAVVLDPGSYQPIAVSMA